MNYSDGSQWVSTKPHIYKRKGLWCLNLPAALWDARYWNPNYWDAFHFITRLNESL